MTKQLMWILWPSFLVAGAMEGVFFSLFDPHELRYLGETIEISRIGAYTVGFLCFWMMCAVSGAFSVWLSRSTGTAPNR